MPRFLLRTGFEDLQVDHWVDQELVTKMATEGFVAPELDLNAVNACCKPLRYVLYKCTYVPYNGTFGTSDQGQTLDM